MSNPIDNIRSYVLEARSSRDQDMEIDVSDAKTEARLDQTIKELQDRLRARKLELEKVSIVSSLIVYYRVSYLVRSRALPVILPRLDSTTSSFCAFHRGATTRRYNFFSLSCFQRISIIA